MTKVTITLKDPDALYDAITEAVDTELDSTNLDAEEKDAIREIRREKISEIANKWFTWGEYLSVEIDTEEKTIKVLENDQY